MKNLIILFVLMFLTSCSSSKYNLKQLQGAWWSSFDQPTADFGIFGNEVWLDDDLFHPCMIEGDLLIFVLDNDRGLVKNKIISVKKDILVLEYIETKERTKYTLKKGKD